MCFTMIALGVILSFLFVVLFVFLFNFAYIVFDISELNYIRFVYDIYIDFEALRKLTHEEICHLISNVIRDDINKHIKNIYKKVNQSDFEKENEKYGTNFIFRKWENASI